MEIKEDGGVSLDFNETLFITREMANKYKHYARCEKQCQLRYEYFKDKVDSYTDYQKSVINKLEYNGKLKKEYQSWYNLYELLLKNKRFKKQS